MPNAQGLRLIEALEEFIRVYEGDTGTRRGGLRSQIDPAARELVSTARQLHGTLTGTYGAGDATERDTPGSRAAKAASAGEGSTGTRARELMGAMTGAGGSPAGGGMNEGGTT